MTQQVVSIEEVCSLDSVPRGFAGAPRAADVLIVVDLDSPAQPEVLDRAREVLQHRWRIVVGIGHKAMDESRSALAAACTVALTTADAKEPSVVRVENLERSVEALYDAIDHAPRASIALAGLLRASATIPVEDALVCESFAYSMLQSGPEFADWLAKRPARMPIQMRHPLLRVDRCGSRLEIVLNDPARRNAVGTQMRLELVDALTIAAMDPGLTAVELRGEGPAFSSGGDLNEFGLVPDPATGHLYRLDAHPGRLLHECAARTTAFVHGPCIGAGIEFAAFASRVMTHPAATFRLPEVGMGLMPGAGGTVSITRRIGRWRTAWLAMTGETIDAVTAHRWGLVDEIHPRV